MWFEATNDILCHCKKWNCAKGFPMCHYCLPSRDYLLKNYKTLNANYENICGHFSEKDEEYDNHISTNCALTTSMIQLEFGFLIGRLTFDDSVKNVENLFQKLQMTNFCQVEIRSKKTCGIHLMTIIGDFVAHSFLSEYPLRIKKIDANWINTLQDCMDGKIEKYAILCEIPKYIPSGSEHLVYWFPHSNWDYRDSYKRFKQQTRK